MAEFRWPSIQLKLFDIPIDYYAKMNMEGFQDIVDAVGGVTVENDMNLPIKATTYPKGTLTLNGKEALIYSRIRKEDPRGDFDRQMRQRQVIQAIMKEGSSLSSLANYRRNFRSSWEECRNQSHFDENDG